ncbi:unnamed protein product [Oikopleura dioica]|uniref:Uncharacterized protein n=1 Tax=Oikopleura dioica TaxID=34765 RepID=E4YW58_OIKDI|nr:unnamed protein product [Oikopleura dioica]
MILTHIPKEKKTGIILTIHVKISFGGDGEKAYEDANATFLAQTMSHTAMTLNRHHMGTAL